MRKLDRPGALDKLGKRLARDYSDDEEDKEEADET
jgi:hypothetical protein